MKLQVIIGTTRTGRVSDRVAKWAAAEAKNLANTEVEIVDLEDYELPFFNEAISPQYNPDRKPEPAVQKWLDKVAEADAYVVVTPEYNRSIPGVLKNAYDYFDFQVALKPTAIVAHGSTGGAQAAAHLRGVLAGVKSFNTPTTTYINGRAGELLDEDGNLVDEVAKSNAYSPQAALKNTLNELKTFSDALASARTKLQQ